MLTEGEASTIKEWLDISQVQVERIRTEANAGTNLLGRVFPFMQDGASESLQNIAGSAEQLWSAYQGIFLQLLTSPDEAHEEAINLVEALKRLANSGQAQSATDFKRAVDITDVATGGGASNLAKTAVDKVFAPTGQALVKLGQYAIFIGLVIAVIALSPSINALGTWFPKKKRNAR